MTGVLLRCPHCGTTKSSFGECEACHEAQVRYYCTNHSPGQWLDAPKCARCGAVFGQASPSPAPAPAVRPERTSPSARPGPTRPSPRTPRADFPKARPREEADYDSASTDRPDAAEPPDVRRGGGVLLPGLDELLKAAARRRMSRESSADRESVPVRRGMGCMMRLVLMAVFFMLSLVAGLFVTAGSLFQMFRF